MHFVPNAAAALLQVVHLSLFASLAVVGAARQCRSDGASVVSDKQGGKKVGELLALELALHTASRCSAPRNVKVCTRSRAGETADPILPDTTPFWSLLVRGDLTRSYHFLFSSSQRSVELLSYTFGQKQCYQQHFI